SSPVYRMWYPPAAMPVCPPFASDPLKVERVGHFVQPSQGHPAGVHNAVGRAPEFLKRCDRLNDVVGTFDWSLRSNWHRCRSVRKFINANRSKEVLNLGNIRRRAVHALPDF